MPVDSDACGESIENEGPAGSRAPLRRDPGEAPRQRPNATGGGTEARSPLPGLRFFAAEELFATEGTFAAEPRGADSCPASADDLALLAFTSGSTARPRAVELSHAHLVAELEALVGVRGGGPEDALLPVLPPAHLFELVVGLLAPLRCGARVVYPGSLLPNRLVEALRECRITRALAVPALVEAVYDEILDELVESGLLESDRRHQHPAETARRLREQLSDRDTERIRTGVRDRIGSSFHTLGVGGAAIDPVWAELLAPFGISLEVGYGLTEAGPIVSLGVASRSPRGSVGKPLPGVEVRIGDGAEILVRSPHAMRGYFRDPDGTASAFAGGWLHTGDSGRLDDEGFLFVTGRLKEVIVTSAGETLYPEEAEPYYESPLFAELCVIPLPGPHGNDTPALIVVPASPEASGEELDAAMARLRAAAPSRCRVTRLVRLDQPLPRTALGKVRRRALAEALSSGGLPDPSAPAKGGLP